MRLSKLKPKQIAHSQVTNIYYKKADGILHKFSMDGGRVWETAAYSLDDNHFVLATKQQENTINQIIKEKK